MEPGPLWLGEGDTPVDHRRPSGRRRAGAMAAAGVCLALVGVPVGLVLSSGGANVALPPPHVGHNPKAPAHLGTGPAEQRVVSALSATTDAGSFAFSYIETQTGRTLGGGSSCDSSINGVAITPGGSSPATTGQVARSSPTVVQTGTCIVPETSETGQRTVVSGKGTLDTDPMKMVVSSSLGPSARIDGTSIWISSGAGLAPSTGASSGSGSPLAQFAFEIEGALGKRAGGVGVLSASSPTGYLDLDQTEVTGADQVGTSTLGGVRVTDYEVSLDPTVLTSSSSGTTPEEAEAIQGALTVLKKEGLSGIRAHMAVDASGYIRQAATTASFSDGTVTLETTLSTFGCAGTVLMPGQQGTTTAPTGCTSPDTGSAPVTPASTTSGGG